MQIVGHLLRRQQARSENGAQRARRGLVELQHPHHRLGEALLGAGDREPDQVELVDRLLEQIVRGVVALADQPHLRVDLLLQRGVLVERVLLAATVRTDHVQLAARVDGGTCTRERLQRVAELAAS